MLLSLSEGIANAALEAMSCELPVVITDCGGMGEAIKNEVEGFLVPVRCPQAAGEALVKLAQDKDLRIRMVKAGRERVMKEFKLSQQICEWTSFFDRIHAGFDLV
jgi:glycosyltransferase involved in cell wall biosynthesis